jgi:hypothetical protein
VGCILYLHKIYTTPTVQTNSCNLVVQTQNVVISSTPNPQFATASSLTTPNSQDPVLPLSAQTNGFLTLRTFADGNPSANYIKGLVTNALKPVSVSQSFDTSIAAANAGCAVTNSCPPPPATLAIALASLPSGQYGTPYTAFNLTGANVVIGGAGALTWSLVSSTAPGLSLGTCGNLPCITGTPTAAGNFTIHLHVADSGSPQQTDDASIAITVNPAPLTITADNRTMLDGTPVPALTATYTGLVLNDTPTNLGPGSTGALSCTTTATSSSPVGTYPITCSGQSSPNYTISYVNGTLTVAGYTFTLTPPKSPAQLGSSVPVIWTLQDPSGAYITDLSTVTEVDSIFNGPAPPGGCVASLTGTFLVLYTPATGAKGNSNLRYVSPGFQFNWDTTVNTTTGKGCYTVKISLKDGTSHATASVQLK